MSYSDILYEKQGGVAWITINRPEVRNAFRTRLPRRPGRKVRQLLDRSSHRALRP
jgi:1,4-dihydroxy-2-naphthoyl-CoA synthase